MTTGVVSLLFVVFAVGYHAEFSDLFDVKIVDRDAAAAVDSSNIFCTSDATPDNQNGIRMFLAGGLEFDCSIRCSPSSALEVEDTELMAERSFSVQMSRLTKYKMVVDNDLDYSIIVLWKDFNGEEVSYGIQKPTVWQIYTTYEEHTWIFRYYINGSTCGISIGVLTGSTLPDAGRFYYVKLSQFIKSKKQVVCVPVT